MLLVPFFFIIILFLLVLKIDTSCYSFVTTTSTTATATTTTADNINVAISASSTMRLATTSSTASTSSTPASPSLNDGISVGFIGCGTIASSIATGLVLAHNSNSAVTTKIKSMIVSRRSESKSNQLKELVLDSNNENKNNNENENNNNNNNIISFDITDNNQKIVNEADIIFLTVLPAQAEDVLKNLKFDAKRHILISLVSTTNLEQLANYSKLNLSNVSKMICLPSIARHEGIALLCCGNDNSNNDNNNVDNSNDDNNNSNANSSDNSNKLLLTTLLNTMGGCVVLDTEYDLESCMVTTCTMGPLYGTMKKQRDWLLENTNGSLTKKDATNLVMKQFQGAILDATYKFNKEYENEDNDNEDNNSTDNNTDDEIDILENLINEQTPGGLNEQALKNYNILGGLHNIQQKVMDLIVNRIRGISNGEIK